MKRKFKKIQENVSLRGFRMFFAEVPEAKDKHA